MTSLAATRLSGPSRLWLAGILLLTALGIGELARMGGLELHVYDVLQKYQYRTASNQILLVADTPADDGRARIWEAEQFGLLLGELSKMGARVVVATEPLALPDIPSPQQIEALTELERQATRAGGGRGELGRLKLQLAGFRTDFDAQQVLRENIKDSGNVLFAVKATENSDGAQLAPGCTLFAANIGDTSPESLKSTRNVKKVIAPPDSICTASSGLGFNIFEPDKDGVIRRTNLLTQSNGSWMPSLALATWAAMTGNNSKIVMASSNALMVGDRALYTGDNFEVLTRHYNESDTVSEFEAVSVDDIMKGRVSPEQIEGRVILIGEGRTVGSGALKTPAGQDVSPLVITASNLSNIINGDYLLRPDWMPVAEYVLLAVIVGIIAFWVPTLPLTAGIAVGLITAATLVGVETWLLVFKGIWIQLGTLALFSLLAIGISQAAKIYRVGVKAQPPRRSLSSVNNMSWQHDPLDLEFSVLRQQPVTEESKERMYQISLEHGLDDEFAKAERVLNHLAKHDPDYKDISALKKKLAARKKRHMELEQQPVKEPPVPTAVAQKQQREAAEPAPERKAYKPLSPAPAPAPAEETGSKKTLGRYVIDRELGQGAMATVYLGTDPNIGRQVAIKTVALAEEFDENKLENAREQFRREAESAGRLNHPNIIAIYDAGEDQDVSYLAMEYFEGDSLLTHAQRDNLLPASWVLELMARAADALDYAHRQNVVHRDIKPANILYDAARDDLKLTDFGIARLTDNNRTKTGIILGTPSYMSPEQLSASGVSGKSDLYSLGVTTYQLLAGVAPFRADSIPKLMDKIMNSKPESICKIRVSLPDSVDKAIATALEKDPEDRFKNGRAMAMALREAAEEIGAAK